MIVDNGHVRVLGEKWFDSYVKMNNDSSEVTRSAQKRDALYIDMLKDLGSEEINIQCKIHILLLLQENASIIIPSVKEVQEVVLSLKELFNSREKHLSDQKFKCHLMASIVTILISYETVEEKSPLLFALTVEIKDFMVQIINAKKREKVLCSMACKCLEELERYFPGLLLSEADTVFATCQSQNSAVFQSYASLLSLIINNAVQMKSLVKKPFREQEEKSHGNVVQYSRTSSCVEIDILPIVIFMMDCVPFMSSMTAYHIMKRLVEIITDTPDLLPMTFKAYVPRLILTNDIPLFHLSFLMHKAFGSDLFTIQEEQSLLYQLVSLSCHPGLTVSHRLLFMEWISICLDKKDQKYSRWNLTTEQLQSFAVGPFDGPDTLEKKLKLIATFTPQNQFSVLPVNTLQRFVKPIQNIRGSSSLFRTLFAYMDLHINTTLMDKIHRLLLNLVETSPHLTHHILDLLQCVRLHHPTSSLPEDTMRNLVKIVTTMPLEKAKNNLELSLLILMTASTEKPEICNPKVILLFLKFILQNIPQTEDWLLGNSILAVCCVLLQHQSIDIFYSDIGAILFMMMKYKDVDIRVQAKIYYGVLTSLSSDKIQKVFQGYKQHIDTGHCFNNIATGTSSFHIAHPIQHLQTPTLKLLKSAHLIQSESPFFEDTYVQDAEYNFFEESEGYAERYQDYLSQADFISPVSFPLCLHFADEAEEKFQMLFGLLIKVHCSPSCGKIKNIEMPILSRSNLKLGRTDNIIYLEIYPEVPIPPHLEFRAEFTCQDGRSYQCEIPGISMQFEDLFLPLPVFPCDVGEAYHNFHRRQLFCVLWTSFSNNAGKGLSYSMCQQSAFNMKLGKDDLGFLMARWNKYRICNFPSSSENHECAFNVGIFIPKCCHILMKIAPLTDFTTINIVTDDWKILPSLESYLTDLQSEDR